MVLCEFRSEVGEEGGSPGCSGNGELFYGTGAVICSLIGAGLQPLSSLRYMSYTKQNGRDEYTYRVWMVSGGSADPFGGRRRMTRT